MIWIVDRPITYNSSLVYDEITETWITKDGRGGSRFQSRILVIDELGFIYIGS